MTSLEIIGSFIGVFTTVLALLAYVVKRTVPSVSHLLKNAEKQNEYIANLTTGFQTTVNEGYAIQKELSKNIAKNNDGQDRLTAMIKELIPKKKKK